MALTVTPETLLASLGVSVEERAPSRMGKADARTAHPSPGKEGKVAVMVRKGLSPDRRAWVLWHEATHVLDCTKRLPDGRRVGYHCLLGYGRISGQLASDLNSHEQFLIRLSDHRRTWVLEDGRELTIQEIKADPSISAGTKSRLTMKDFEAGVRFHRYKGQSLELLAEAVAGAICRPESFDAGAPGLRAKLQAALSAEGFPL